MRIDRPTISDLTDTQHGHHDAPGGGNLTVSYVLKVFCPGKPYSGATMFWTQWEMDVEFPIDFAGGKALAKVGATSTSVLTLKANGAMIGTITFAAGGSGGEQQGTFAAASGLSAPEDDTFEQIAPATQDATLSDITITYRGTRAAL